MCHLEEEKHAHCNDNSQSQTHSKQCTQQRPERQDDLRLPTRAIVEIPGPVEAIVERHCQADCGHGTACHGTGQECYEVTMVVMTHASVDPGTMVIHLHDAPPTSPAVMGPGGLVSLTLTTVLQLTPVSVIIW